MVTAGSFLFMLGGGNRAHPVGFTNISIYDKTERKWYSQLASGQVPDPRAEFCIVGIQGQKSSSFEMWASILVCILRSKQESHWRKNHDTRFIHGGAINYVVWFPYNQLWSSLWSFNTGVSMVSSRLPPGFSTWWPHLPFDKDKSDGFDRRRRSPQR